MISKKQHSPPNKSFFSLHLKELSLPAEGSKSSIPQIFESFNKHFSSFSNDSEKIDFFNEAIKVLNAEKVRSIDYNQLLPGEKQTIQKLSELLLTNNTDLQILIFEFLSRLIILYSSMNLSFLVQTFLNPIHFILQNAFNTSNISLCLSVIEFISNTVQNSTIAEILLPICNDLFQFIPPFFQNMDERCTLLLKAIRQFTNYFAPEITHMNPFPFLDFAFTKIFHDYQPEIRLSEGELPPQLPFSNDFYSIILWIFGDFAKSNPPTFIDFITSNNRIAYIKDLIFESRHQFFIPVYRIVEFIFKNCSSIAANSFFCDNESIRKIMISVSAKLKNPCSSIRIAAGELISFIIGSYPPALDILLENDSPFLENAILFINRNPPFNEIISTLKLILNIYKTASFEVLYRSCSFEKMLKTFLSITDSENIEAAELILYILIELMAKIKNYGTEEAFSLFQTIFYSLNGTERLEVYQDTNLYQKCNYFIQEISSFRNVIEP